MSSRESEDVLCRLSLFRVIWDCSVLKSSTSTSIQLRCYVVIIGCCRVAAK